MPVGNLERLIHFKKVPALAGMASHDLAVLTGLAQQRFFSEGTLLLRESEPCPAVHVIVHGWVAQWRKGRCLGRAGPGSAVGGLQILAGDEEGIEARAAVDTVSLELRADT